MTYQEEAAWFTSGASRLLGIVSRPHAPERMGVVVLVGGPQYRVGSHRQFVLLARALAEAGYAVLRFDFCGMGDSTGLPQRFEDSGTDIAAAIDTLQQAVPEVHQVALWGLCDGASAALLYWHSTRDARVLSLCLVNPWVRTEASQARTRVHSYYLQRLGQAAFWRKLLHGQVGLAALQQFSQSLWHTLHSHWRAQAAPSNGTSTSTSLPAPMGFQQRMALAWAHFPGRIVLLLSQDDFTAKEFLQHAAHDSAWRKALRHPRLVRHDLAGADHTFSGEGLLDHVARLTVAYALRPPEGRAGTGNGSGTATGTGMRKHGRPPRAT